MSSSYIPYTNINQLEEFSMIAGTEFTLEFNVFEEDGVNPLDLGGATITWVLCPYGQPDYNVLQKTATITGTNTFEVLIGGDDTEELSGKYIQQPVIVSFTNQKFRPAQGAILIQPLIPLN